MSAFEEVTGAELQSDLSKEDKAALRKHPKIAAVLARIKSERAAAKSAALDAKAATADEGDLADFAA